MLSEIDQMDERNRLADLDRLVRGSKDMNLQNASLPLENLLPTTGDMQLQAKQQQWQQNTDVDACRASRDNLALSQSTERHNLLSGGPRGAEHKRNERQSDSAVSHTVRRALQKLHHTQADLRAAQLQSSHMQLQLQALTASEQQVRGERDSMEYAAAEAEQDKILLEARLQQVAGFEAGGRGLSDGAGADLDYSLADEQQVRGELLHLANGKIRELLGQVQAQEAAAVAAATQQRADERLGLENRALREEVTHLSAQLAQRTVLYSAQERRLHDSTRVSHSLHEEKDTELAELRARLQDLERRFESTDRERIECIFRERQTQESCRELEERVALALERALGLDSELAALNSQNASLHAAVDHLRGAEYGDIERDLAADVEIIRTEAGAREEQLRMQVDSARALLASEAQGRERVLDEVAALRKELASKDELLRALSSGEGTIAQRYYSDEQPQQQQQQEEEDEEEEEEADALEMTDIPSVSDSPNDSGDLDEYAALFAASPIDGAGASASQLQRCSSFYDNDEPKSLYGGKLANATLRVLLTLVPELVPSAEVGEEHGQSHYPLQEFPVGQGKSLLDSLNSSDAAAANSASTALCSRVEALIERAYACEAEPANTNTPPASASDSALTSLSAQLVKAVTCVARQYAAIEVAFHQRLLNESFSLSRSVSDAGGAFATPSASVATSQSLSRGFLTGQLQHNGSGTGHDKSIAERDEELAALMEELGKRKRKERKLALALQQTRQQLTVVLERAASLPPMDEQGSVSSSSYSASASVSVTTETQAQNSSASAEALRALQAECELLRQRAEGYAEEVVALIDAAHSSRSLGFHEAAELHVAKVAALEQQVAALEAQLEQAADGASLASPSPAQAQVQTQTQTQVQAQAETQTQTQTQTQAQTQTQPQMQPKSEEDKALRAALDAERLERRQQQQQLEAERAEHSQELGQIYDMRSRITQEHAAQLQQLQAERAQTDVQVQALLAEVKAKHAGELERAGAGATAAAAAAAAAATAASTTTSSTSTSTSTEPTVASVPVTGTGTTVACNTDMEYFSPRTRVQTQAGAEMETVARASQTVFSVADSQVEQRVEFALAHARLQGDNRYEHDLQMQRLQLEREHQLQLHDKIAALHREYEAQLVSSKQKLSSKYKVLLEKQRAEFATLRGHLSLALAVERQTNESESMVDVDALRGSLQGSLSSLALGSSPPVSIPEAPTEAQAWAVASMQKTLPKASSSNKAFSLTRTPVPDSPHSQSSSPVDFDSLIADSPFDEGGTKAEAEAEAEAEADDEVNRSAVSYAGSVATLSPPRWDGEANASLANLTQTPQLERGLKASKVAAARLGRRQQQQQAQASAGKDTVSPISIGKAARSGRLSSAPAALSDRTADLSKPKKGLELSSLRALRSAGLRPVPAKFPLGRI